MTTPIANTFENKMDKFDTYFFDCDGVLLEGLKPLPFASEVIR
jgi:ribonucleotide monophosphatase NagD (HAD superfamily)